MLHNAGSDAAPSHLPLEAQRPHRPPPRAQRHRGQDGPGGRQLVSEENWFILTFTYKTIMVLFQDVNGKVGHRVRCHGRLQPSSSQPNKGWLTCGCEFII